MNLNQLSKKYENIDCRLGTDKGITHSYLDIYEKELSHFIKKEPIILELGVATGSSLLLWRDFFINAIIHGVDRNNQPNIIKDVPNIYFHKIDLNNIELLSKEFNSLCFDIIIDDASHRSNQQINSFYILYPYLKTGGFYFIEDVNSSRFLIHKIKYITDKIQFFDLSQLTRSKRSRIIIIRK
jgi:hypothetical protein